MGKTHYLSKSTEIKLDICSILRIIPDKKYISAFYYYKTKKHMNWNNPQLLNEKLQWLKVYNRNPKFTMMVDKIEVKKYIAETIGEEYVIPTLGVWDKAENIDWGGLPQKFVLKCSHDSHSVIVCKNKDELDKDATVAFLNRCLKRNAFWFCREWPYKDVKPRVFAEQYIEQENGEELVDYKFYAYGGKPQYFMYSVGEASHNAHNHKFDMDCNSIDHLFKESPAIEQNAIHLPQNIDDMIRIAETLSIGHQHIRVDLYNVNGHIYFGEFTFFTGEGFVNMVSREYSDYLASLIELKPYEG